MADKTVTYTEQAIDTMTAMYDHVDKLRAYYQEHDPQIVAEAERTLTHVMRGLAIRGFGDTATVSRDGDLSLYVVEGSFVYGVIWHATKRHCLTPGCPAYLRDDAATYTYYRSDEVPAMCENHQPSYPYDAPHPGSWSVHS